MYDSLFGQKWQGGDEEMAGMLLRTAGTLSRLAER